MKLADNVAISTGSSRGVEKNMAVELAKEGCHGAAAEALRPGDAGERARARCLLSGRGLLLRRGGEVAERPPLLQSKVAARPRSLA